MVSRLVQLTVIFYLACAVTFAQEGQGETVNPSLYRVAVVDFVVTDLTGAEANAALGNYMATAFQPPLFQSKRFTVVSRAELGTLLDEISLGEQGVVAPEQAKEFGRMSSVDIIIAGTIAITGKDTLTVTANFIRVEDGITAASYTIPGKGPEDFAQIAFELVDLAAHQFPQHGEIIEIQNGRVFINLGSNNGLVSEEVSGVVFRNSLVGGRLFSEQIGTLKVIQIGPEASIIEVETNPGMDVQIGDVVTLQSLGDRVFLPSELPATGNLVLTGSPVGASIFINNEPKGTLSTEGVNLNLPTGSYEVRVEAAGYVPNTQVKEILGGQTIAIDVSLVQNIAFLKLNVSPDNAVLYLDDKQVDTKELSLSSGTYTLRAELEGYEPKTQTVSLVAGQTEAVSLELTMQQSSLLINLDLEDFKIYVDDVDYGNVREIPLPAGTYNVKVEAPGYSAMEFSQVLEPGKASAPEIALQPLASAGAATNAEDDSNSSSNEETAATVTTETSSADMGTLHISSNIENVTLELSDGVTSQTVTLEGLESDIELPDSLYTVNATAPGAKPIEDIVSISIGQTESLILEFEVSSIKVQAGLINDNGTPKLIVFTNLPDESTTYPLVVQGPATWNEGKAVEGIINGDKSKFWMSEIPVESGEYVVAVNTKDYGEISTIVQIDPANSLPIPEGLKVDLTPQNLAANWTVSKDVSNYEVIVYSPEGEQVYEDRNYAETSKGKIVSPVNLIPNINYQICVIALVSQSNNTVDSNNLFPTSRVCETVQVKTEVVASPSGPDGPTEPPKEEPKCGVIGKPPCGDN